MKTVAIVQARLGSTRFPKKVMKRIGSRSLIELLLTRLSRSSHVDKIIVATTDQPVDDELAEHVRSLRFDVHRGSESDVLDRFLQAAKNEKADTVVRITGDCPLIEPAVVDAVIETHTSKAADYTSNISPPTFPDGLDTEVFTFAALKRAHSEASQQHEREHVTPYIRESGNFNIANHENATDKSSERWTVDEPSDLIVIRNIVKHFEHNVDFNWHEVLQLKQDHPKIFHENQFLVRNEGMNLGTGQKLWKRAKKVIPGGNMLLSKRSEMFLPDQWPAYFSKAKGCEVWDLDGRKYTDMSIMGIGTNVLGYGHPEIDEAVVSAVRNGNMSTLNCPEEVFLAERLSDLHPWAEQVRLARTGGEANAIAIRIARAASKKDKVAICGYHGWHDWYLSANLGNEETLAGHLLPGLEPNGVPQNLRGSCLPFTYNHFDELEQLTIDHDIGVIKMEVCRNAEPSNDFLQRVRTLANDNGIVLIFDECTSGFRETLGGLHKKYSVEPDIAIFGKTLGNGYAISSVIGRAKIMSAAQSTFISSTFWTERIGPSAALKTLEVMEREKSWETITNIGRKLTDRWHRLARKYDITLQTSGIPALTSFSIKSNNWLKYKTYITQEMLKQNFLAANSVYVCTEHKDEVVDEYFDLLDPIFATIAGCEAGRNIDGLLRGPVCHSGFKRLN